MEKLNSKPSHNHHTHDEQHHHGNHNHLSDRSAAVTLLNGHGHAGEVQTDQCHRSKITFTNPDGEGYMHLGTHHHHHKRSTNGTNPALMVLAGDVVHNVFDGLAIGIAFAGGISGGKVFCSFDTIFSF